jgi:hypothetical protein
MNHPTAAARRATTALEIAIARSREFCMPDRSARGAFATLEIMAALVVIALACVPVLTVTRRSLDTVSVARQRAAARMLARELATGVARGGTALLARLAPSAADPRVLESADAVADFPELAPDGGPAELRATGSRPGVTLRSLRVARSARIFECEVSWRPAGRTPEVIRYAQIALLEHLH